MNSSDRRILVTGTVAFTFISVANYLASTPLRFLAAAAGLLPLIYAIRKLNNDYGVPLFYYRREGPNYWSGAFGGLTALIFSLYGSLLGFDNISILSFAADISVGLIYLLLLSILLTGAVLKDVKEGFIEIKQG